MRREHLATVALYNVFIVLCVVNSSSFSPHHYYDELITKLQAQAMAESDYDIAAHQQKLQENEREEPYNQKGNKRILLMTNLTIVWFIKQYWKMLATNAFRI
jgi:hypothetical protein